MFDFDQLAVAQAMEYNDVSQFKGGGENRQFTSYVYVFKVFNLRYTIENLSEI